MRLRALALVGTALAVAGVLIGAPEPVRGDAAWMWPVPAPHPVVRGFEAPASEWGAGHRGIDVAVAVGTPVVAPADGRVTFAGRVVDRDVLAIDVGGALVAGFEPVTPSVRAGAVVHRGERIGVVATGGTHPAGVLHIGARAGGAYVSPLLYLGGWVRPVLLPLSLASRSAP